MSEQKTDPVRVAMDASEQALRRAEQKAGGSDVMTTRETCAIAIAAFLRALPEDTAYTMVPLPLELAAAVEAVRDR